jgi:methyl-accepting chemotaxis protein
VTTSAQAAAQISASAGQQSTGMSQIRQAIGNIQQAAQQNLAATRQAEAAAQELNRVGSNLLDLVGTSGKPLHYDGRRP